MGTITMIATPELQETRSQAARYLEKIECQSLLLPFPQGLDELVAQIGEGLPYNYVIGQLIKSDLIPPPLETWERRAKPLLEALPKIKDGQDTQFYCYDDPFFIEFPRQILVEITALTLRTSISGNIEPERWRALLQKEQKHQEPAFLRELEFIIKKASNHDESACVYNWNADYIISELKKEGFEINLKCIGKRYSPLPLDVLRNKIEEISDEELKKLVRWHIKYLREYVLPSQNLDDAYQKWNHRTVHEIIKWLRKKLNLFF